MSGDLRARRIVPAAIRAASFALAAIIGTLGISIVRAAAAPPATFDECEALVRADPSDFRCFGMVAYRTRQWEEAARRLDALLRANPAQPRALWSLAYIESTLRHERALELYLQAADSLEAAGIPAESALALCDLANDLASRGRFDEVDAVLERADVLAGRSGLVPIVAKVRTEQGWRAYSRQDYGAAEAILSSVETAVAETSATVVQSRWLSGMGAICLATGRPGEALRWYEREADFDRTTGDSWNGAVALYNTTLALSHLGAGPHEVVPRLREALDAAIASGNRQTEASTLMALAHYSTDAGERRSHKQRALQIGRQTGLHNTTLLAMRTLGENYLSDAPQDRIEGRRLLDEALAIARQRADLHHIARSLALQSHLAWHAASQAPADAGARERAIDDSLLALDAIERIRDRQQDELIRARTFGEWAYPFHRTIALLLATAPASGPNRADLEIATNVTERMRASLLLDEIAAHATIDDSPPLATLGDVEGLLAGDEAILSFVVADLERQAFPWTDNLPESWLVVHVRGGTRVYPLPDRARIEIAVRLFVGLFEARDGSEAGAAAGLYADLIGTAIADLPPSVTRLVVVPDGILHRLPFEALRIDDQATPIGAHWQITLAPSITTWLRCRAAGGVASLLPALALADPAIVAAGAPAAAGARSVPGAGTVPGGAPAAAPSWTADSPAPMGPLPHTRRETRAILRYLGGGSVILEGEAATEKAVKTAALDRYGIVHFAAHGLVDDQRPDRSGILLAPGAGGEDGLLQIREIVDLDLDGRIVVLSACRSASGALIAGQGVMGLARAFFVAGARTVVGSLWPLKDDEAAALFESFYRHLGDGASVGAAMTAARLERMRAGAPAAAWAGVVVMGDGDAMLKRGPRPRPLRWWPAVAALVTGVMILVAARAWRRARPGSRRPVPPPG